MCKQHFPIMLFRQPIFTWKTFNHTATYDHASADSNLSFTLLSTNVFSWVALWIDDAVQMWIQNPVEHWRWSSSWKLLSIFAKSSILDVRLGSEYASELHATKSKRLFTCSKLTIERPEQCVMSMTSFWCLYCQLWTDFTHCSGVSVVDFKQENADSGRGDQNHE